MISIQALGRYDDSLKIFFLPSGNLTQVWKITCFLTWKRTISMAIFNSYVKLPKVSKFSITMRAPPVMMCLGFIHPMKTIVIVF